MGSASSVFPSSRRGSGCTRVQLPDARAEKHPARSKASRADRRSTPPPGSPVTGARRRRPARARRANWARSPRPIDGGDCHASMRPSRFTTRRARVVPRVAGGRALHRFGGTARGTGAGRRTVRRVCAQYSSRGPPRACPGSRNRRPAGHAGPRPGSACPGAAARAASARRQAGMPEGKPEGGEAGSLNRKQGLHRAALPASSIHSTVTSPVDSARIQKEK